ncbi:MAG: hypothetical protein KDB26_02405, partial [Microthrixaceae bacterium]|nr:hypothetical protein [Microthrixaceae bacterium]
MTSPTDVISMGMTGETAQVSNMQVVAARSLSAAIVASLVAMAVLHALNRNLGIDTSWFTNMMMGLGLGGAGSLLAHKVPHNAIGWIMLLAAGANATAGVAREWAVFVYIGGRDLPGAAFAAWWGSWPFVISLATLPLVLLLFPDGKLLSRRWMPAVWALVIFTILETGQIMFEPGPFTDDLPNLNNPFGVNWPGLAALGTIGRAGFPAIIVLSIAALAVRTRTADTETRQQLRWVFAGGTFLAIEVSIELLPWTGDHLAFAWTGPLALAVFLASLAVAVLRYRLWDLDLLIRMSIIYGALIAIVTAVYVAVVGIFGVLTDSELRIGPSLVAAAVGVGVFTMLRDRVQRGVERLLYGDRGDPHRALAKVGEKLDQADSADAVLDEVVEAVAHSLRLGGVALMVADSGEAARFGDLGLQTHSLPLMFRDSQVGELVVSPRRGSRMGSSEISTLTELARPVAAVVQAVAVGQELKRSRRALITAREEERRLVVRNLHDGLGPALAAVRMKLDSAAILIGSDTGAARAIIAQLAIDLRSTIVDIRRLVYDLQPPQLDEVGLLQAISDQARLFSGPL